MSDAKLTFVVNSPIRDLGEFRSLASMAARLKRHGRVELNISTLAEKARHEIPPGGSPWHEYASLNPTPARFFPDERLAPHVPDEFVRKNRELLLAKAAVLRELKLGAAFWSYEPNFLPETFYQANPQLRGPRTDHPRRSRRPEFAPCIDQEETQAMTTRSVRQLVSHVPELGTYFFKTNDAGPGLCWSDWQYAGRNGPAGCKHTGVGQRVRRLMEAILRGGSEAGRRLTVHMTGNFSAAELRAIGTELPDGCYVRGAKPGSLSVAALTETCYPVRGIFDPLAVLRSLQRLREASPTTVFIDLRASYDRTYEPLEFSQFLLDVVDDFLHRPVSGPIQTLQRLRELCRRWVGPDRSEADADLLLDALIELHEALKFQAAALPRMRTMYGSVSLRYLTRPLVFAPELLTPSEESYFLPHVFNVSHERARTDWLDVHGTRHLPSWVTLDSLDPRIGAVDQVRERLNNAAECIDRATPRQSPWRRMAGAVRLYGLLLRGCGNFYAAQIIRDRHAARISRPAITPPARADWSGDNDLSLFNDLMRDELDAASDIQRLLCEHGLSILAHATRPEDEDTFLLGPDVLEQLLKKQSIMRDHWLDAERYLTTPNK